MISPVPLSHQLVGLALLKSALNLFLLVCRMIHCMKILWNTSVMQLQVLALITSKTKQARLVQEFRNLELLWKGLSQKECH